VAAENGVAACGAKQAKATTPVVYLMIAAWRGASLRYADANYYR
jgi:hypothetical protein